MSEQRVQAVNAPWPVVALVLVLLGGFALQSALGADAVAQLWGFAPRDLATGRWLTPVSAIFLHGGWLHVLANTAFALAFATPVARRLGDGLKGAAAFFGFYLICGVAANLGYAALNPQSGNVVIGASGAVAGMMGAASRLIGRSDGRLAPLFSQPVIAMAGGWIAVNLVFGFLAPAWSPGSGGAPIAWQVHLLGYAIGLLLFAPLLRMLGRQGDDHAMGN
ncbi:MAG: rhomboid family intramembrane serine protease [Caulobacteraceae bacterium]|nr:rhomboid family intramembrane serine protease [Caulobacteraceae bacterium]